MQYKGAMQISFGATSVEADEEWWKYLVLNLPSKLNGEELSMEQLLTELKDFAGVAVAPFLPKRLTNQGMDVDQGTQACEASHGRRFAPVIIATTKPIRASTLLIFASRYRVVELPNKPLVRQCSTCYEFGHSNTSPLCRAPRQRCALCTSTSHSTSEHECQWCSPGTPAQSCKHPAQCRNCRGAHKADDASCPMRPYFSRSTRSLVQPGHEKAKQIKTSERIKFEKLVAAANRQQRQSSSTQASARATSEERGTMARTEKDDASQADSERMIEDDVLLLSVGKDSSAAKNAGADDEVEEEEDVDRKKAKKARLAASSNTLRISSSPSRV